MSTTTDLPQRIVVGANGAYWLDFGSHYSMPRVSDDNDRVEVQAVYSLASQPEPTVTEALRHWLDEGEHDAPAEMDDVSGRDAWESGYIAAMDDVAALAAVPAPSPAPAEEPSRIIALDNLGPACRGECSDNEDDHYHAASLANRAEARAASPSPAVAPLDVERLAFALAGEGCFATHFGAPGCTCRKTAQKIAAAYAEASEQEGRGVAGDEPLPGGTGQPPAALRDGDSA